MKISWAIHANACWDLLGRSLLEAMERFVNMFVNEFALDVFVNNLYLGSISLEQALDDSTPAGGFFAEQDVSCFDKNGLEFDLICICIYLLRISATNHPGLR